nr:immunoglobulin heavy chain junction region [Mus musculus]
CAHYYGSRYWYFDVW